MILGDYESPREEDRPPKVLNMLFPLLVIGMLAWLGYQTLSDDSSSSQQIVYSDLIRRVESSPQSIEIVTFIPRTQRIEVRLRSGEELEAHYPSETSQLELQHLLQRQQIRFDSKGTGSSAWWTLLTILLPFVLLLGFWMFLMNRRSAKRTSRQPGDGETEAREPQQTRW